MDVRITRVRELLKTSRHATMATVNTDGSPHNSPYFFVYSPDITKLYWCSRPETMHCQNIERTGQLFVVLFKNNEHATGLYIRAHNGRIAENDEFDAAVVAFNAAQKKADYQQFEPADYAASPTKLYVADIQEMWVNGFEQDEKGMVIRDYREPVTAADLLKS